MTPQNRTLLLILGFVAFSLGSFIWFIATWDAEREQPVLGSLLFPATEQAA